MQKVLIAEDDQIFVETLVKFLSKKGVEALTTGNGIEAIQIIKEKLPDVLLLDIHLPGISGLNVLAQAKEINPKIKVIVISAAADSSTEKQALELGACAFLKKPFIIEVLLKLLTDLEVIE